jgi:hypothetical protein
MKSTNSGSENEYLKRGWFGENGARTFGTLGMLAASAPTSANYNVTYTTTLPIPIVQDDYRYVAGESPSPLRSPMCFAMSGICCITDHRSIIAEFVAFGSVIFNDPSLVCVKSTVRVMG